VTAELLRIAPAEWPGLAGFIVDCNRRADGGAHCLHARHGNDAASHAAELAALSPDAAAFWALRDGGDLQAVVGCEFDSSLQRAWVRGPLWNDRRAADVLLTRVGPALEAALPLIRHFDAFAALSSEPLNGWLAAAGYAPLQVHTLLRAPIVAPQSGDAIDVRRATLSDVPAASALHQALFPAAYVTEADLVRGLQAADCTLLVTADDAGLSGYLFMQDAPADQEAYVDYVGVDAARRGRGLGRALLDAAARWGAARGRGHLALTVREDRRSALELYRRSGFAEVSSARHWRRTVAEPTARTEPHERR